MTKSKNYFKKGRDTWKQKHSEKQRELKLLKLTNRDVRRSREKWKAQAKALEAQLKQLLEQQEQEKKKGKL